uniref:Ras family protein n=1 Tax=Wuchereria bancrofti TaxID=6293 RepID=A0A1I8EPD1_WUCBA
MNEKTELYTNDKEYKSKYFNCCGCCNFCSKRSMTRKQLKFVVVGDGACGKTSLIIAEAGGEFVEQYTPTAFDDYAIEALVNGKTIRRFCPDVPVLVVGNKKDIRNEEEREMQKECNNENFIHHKQFVNFDDAIACAKKFSAHQVIECSAKTKEGIRQVFDAAIRIAVAHRAGTSRRVLNSIMKLKLFFFVYFKIFPTSIVLTSNTPTPIKGDVVIIAHY